MKTLLFSLLLIAAPAMAQTDVISLPDDQFTDVFSASGNGICRAVKPGVYLHAINWRVSGTVSAGNISLTGSHNSDCSSPADIIAATTATSGGNVAATEGFYPYIRIVFGSYAGTGTVSAYYAGFKNAQASTFSGATGNGVVTSETLRVTIASDTTGVVGTELPAPATLADDTSNPTVPGVAGFLMCFDGTTWDRCATSSGNDGTVDANTTRVTLVTNSFQRILSDNTNNDDETQIKATAGVLWAVQGRNSSTTTNTFVKCTNLTAANTTPGSSTVYWSMMIPFGGGFVPTTVNVAFSTALTCYLATGAADSDATDPAQNEVEVYVYYR